MDANQGDQTLPGSMHDGTAASQNAGAPLTDCEQADLARGYKKHPVEKTSNWDSSATPEDTSSGDPFDRGGFLGRQHGTAR